ncbi:oxygen-independent coproporphyrinogen III oxidase [Pelagovum pacificum]|uniref:Coproporphyrinogen-III oxidase n=1 Tax=Pelagovum pacificum TaxID=2588711 RepID=A0A5C5GK28_9RHOB|nr:oxygen-independent coproporphyrinogen III oxidase [Pelagovum pacificum]QQA42720.1 oxygen-independent coproporphyrinogen III oxidase [Pelagovum pacificum]TNY34129.1 oxygen-independent coproporphyrinogen III oxidase [Pelagovum pacificum]
MERNHALKRLGLFEARAPRYTSYPPANHFSEQVDAGTTEDWLRSVQPGSQVSLYLHIPYCRRLCWFCACRTQGTATNRPLVPYLKRLKREIAMVSALLPEDVTIGRVHLGGGTPTILPPDMLEDLVGALKQMRPWSDLAEFSVEIDPTEIDAARVDALARLGMTRASIGVQDFDPVVQGAIGRLQGFDITQQVVTMLREAGVESLNLDVLYGLPHQTLARMTDSIQHVLALDPDRVAFYGYAHVPWMARRQAMIPTAALPGPEERYELFMSARSILTWDSYREIGIDHFARESDSLATADRLGRLRRNFQGYTDDQSKVLIGLGASAISRYPQGFAQNHSTSSKYADAIDHGGLGTVRGHRFSNDDLVRSAMIEAIMCNFAIDLQALAAETGAPVAALRKIADPLLQQFPDHVVSRGDRIEIARDGFLIARLVAQHIDAYSLPEGRHSQAL